MQLFDYFTLLFRHYALFLPGAQQRAAFCGCCHTPPRCSAAAILMPIFDALPRLDISLLEIYAIRARRCCFRFISRAAAAPLFRDIACCHARDDTRSAICAHYVAPIC